MQRLERILHDIISRMALPNVIANAGQYLTSLVVHNLVFPWIKPLNAMVVAAVTGQGQLPEHAYVHCNCLCESREMSVPGSRPLHPDWVVQAPRGRIGLTMPGLQICIRQARLHNSASADAANPAGYRQPSYCVEPQHVPRVNTHGYGPHPHGRPLVCPRCKQRRGVDYAWRKEALKFGVCSTCRTWALENMQPGQSDCTCQPIGNCINNINNNEPRTNHMCVDHDTAYWMPIRIAADPEIDARRRMVRVHKRKGHGWTHKKGVKRVRTPTERRKATRLHGAAPTLVPWRSPDWQANPR